MFNHPHFISNQKEGVLCHYPKAKNKHVITMQKKV